MVVTSKVYGNFLKHAVDGIIDLDRFRVMLLTNSYTPDQDNHDFLNDVSDYEVEGTGYTVGGFLLDNATATYSTSTHELTITCDDEVIGSSSITARYAIFYIDILGAESTAKPLVAYWDFGADETSTSGSFTIDIPATGVVVIPVNAS
jgi:hypothetical protein